MPDPILKINGRDFGPYLRVAHGDGMDPASAESVDIQFTGSTAIGEGQTFVGESLGNVAMSFPLILGATDTDGLYQMIRDIRADLKKGSKVEYQSGSATQSTFFDMEKAKLEPNFEYWLDQSGRCRAQLTVWRRPYGHTGTARVIASAVGTGPMTLLATGIQGDVMAQANYRLRPAGVGTGVRLGPMVYGVKFPVPSGFDPILGAPAIASGALLGATTVTATSLASGRLNGRFASIFGAATQVIGGATSRTMSGWQSDFAPDTFKGRYRVLTNLRINGGLASPAPKISLLRYSFSGASFAQNPESLFLSATTAWQLADLGEVSISPVATTSWIHTLKIDQRATAGTSILNSYALDIEALRLIPLDGGPAGVRTTLNTALANASSIQDTRGVEREVSLRPTLAASPFADFGAAALRGDWPGLPPVGSPMASGPAMLVIDPVSYSANGEPLGNRENRVIVEVRERFSYLR